MQAASVYSSDSHQQQSQHVKPKYFFQLVSNKFYQTSPLCIYKTFYIIFLPIWNCKIVNIDFLFDFIVGLFIFRDPNVNEKILH